MSGSSFTGLSFKDLSFQYQTENALLSDCTFDWPVGSALLFTGDSNGGKSSIFKLLAGLLQPVSGAYVINGQPVGQMSFEEFLPLRLKIGFSFDLGGLINNKSLFENLMLPLLYHNFYPVDSCEQKVNSLLELFHLKPVSHMRPSMISGSQRKLACVLRALVHEPEWVLLDDPFTGLSEEAVSKLQQLLSDLRQDQKLKQIWISAVNQTTTSFQFDHQVILHDRRLKLVQLNDHQKETAA